MTYYVETPEMGITILSDGVGKPFSVRPAADDDLIYPKNHENFRNKKSRVQFY